jgi:polyphosphate glucokinase
LDILGIDIGDTGIKGAPVNVKTGELAAKRCRIPTRNVHESWVLVDAAKLFIQHLQGPVTVLNDTVAAGIAEVH